MRIRRKGMRIRRKGMRMRRKGMRIRKKVEGGRDREKVIEREMGGE